VRLTYDANGKETSVTDPLGNTTRMEYDASGNLTAKIDPLGNRASYAYDSAGHLRSTTDPLGNVTTNTFDAKGNIMRSENALGFASDYQYDTQGRLTMLMDALGNTNSQAQYDSADNIRQVTTGSGQAMTFGYDARGNQTTRQSQWVNPNDSNDVRTVATRTDYDTSGNPTKSVDAFGRETVTTLNEFGKVASTRDCYGHVTAYTYDVLGKLIEMLYPDGSATRAVYDENGRVVVAVDRQFPGQPANGTHTVYDAAGQVLVQERLSNVVVQVTSVTNNGSVLSSSHFVSSGGVIVSKRMSYDAAGRVVAVTNFFGQTTRYEYDAAGHNTARIDPSGYRTEYGYDAAGRQTVVRDALGREVHYLYDALNQRVQTIFPDGTSVRTTYDALGRRVSEVNQAGKAKSFEYDAAGRVAAVSLPHVTDPDAANALIQPRSEFTYDAYSNMEVSRDAKGRETQFSYDEMNRQLTRILPLGQVQSNAYNASGQLFRQTDFKGQVTELLYDNFGRITNRNLYAAGSNTPSQKVAIAYDTMGRLDTITDARGTMRYTYDGQTGVSQITTPEGTLHYEYDALGRRVRTHTDNTDTRYTYDNYGRLQTVTAVKRNGQVLSTPETTTYNYDVIGRRQSTTLPNGVTTRYQYDDLDRLTVLTHSNAASGALTTYTYTRNANGLKTGVAELKSGVGVSPITNLFGHTYDALNRLVTETNRFNTNGFNSRYTYDLVGNRLLREVTVGTRTLTTTYRYDANDRLLVESNYVSSLRPSGASIPVLIRDGDGSLQFMCRPQPSAWSYYLIKSVPYFLGLALLIPIALVSRRQWRRIHIVSTDLCPQRALLPRCLAGLLAGLMAWLPFDTRVLADEAALYTALSTDTWGLDGSVTSYEYDANGSVTKKTTKGPKPETVEYSHNLDNRLVSATTTFTNGANHVVRTSHYAYNENGIRVRSESSVTINGVGSGVSTNLYLIDPLNHTGFAQVLEELPAFGAVPTVSYTIGDDVISQATAVATDYFLYDGHGSTRQLMDPSGSVTDEYSYDASGMMIGGNPTTSQPARTSLLYTGEQFDTGLQQYNLRARNYDPSIGRFTSMDPFPGSPDDPQSLHKYAYAHDDPVNNVDPSGQMSLGEVMTCLAIFSIILSYGIAPLLSVLTSGKFLPDASLTGFNLFLPPYVGGGTVAAVVGVLAAMTLGGVPLPILGILQKAGLNVVGSLQRAVTYLNSGSGFGLSLSFEALSDVQDKSLSGWVAIGPAFGIGSSASFGGSIYTGVVWNTNQYEDYAGAFWGAGYGIGTGVSYAQSLFAGSGFTQWGVATGVAFGSSIPISGSVSWTYYYLIAAQRPASYDTLKWTIAVGLLSPTTTIWANWLVRKLYNNPPVALDPVKHVTPLTEDPIKAVFGYPPP
jgi:RHS repeat-associated protein